MSSSWNEEYFDIINFFYWEPQHLGKKKYDTSRYNSLEKVLSHIKNMEVSLNHIFNIYFKLIPLNHLHQLLGIIDNQINKDEYKLQNGNDIEKLNLGDATQPDLSFIGNNNLLAIEMKIGAKTDVDQIMKYALLFYFQQKQLNKEIAQNNLIYITPYKINNIFKDDITNEDDLKSHILNFEYPNETRKGKVNLQPHKNSMMQIAKSMNIKFITYQDLFDYIIVIRDSIDKTNPYSDTVISLHDGLLNELSSRNLV